MRFVFAQLIGMVGDQLEWWGQGLQRKSAAITASEIGLDGTESDQEVLTALSNYLDRK